MPPLVQSTNRVAPQRFQLLRGVEHRLGSLSCLSGQMSLIQWDDYQGRNQSDHKGSGRNHEDLLTG